MDNPPPSTISLTLTQTLAIFYGGDDELYHNRVWLSIHTLASGHCHVIRQRLAEDIYALDPDEVLTHVEVYDKSAYTESLSLRIPESYKHTKVSQQIHTLWRRQEWLESNEKLRLAKLASSTRAKGKTTRDIAEFIARDFARKVLVGQNNELAQRLTVGLTTKASDLDFNISAFITYLQAFNKQIAPERDFTAAYAEYIPTPTQNA